MQILGNMHKFSIKRCMHSQDCSMSTKVDMCPQTKKLGCVTPQPPSPTSPLKLVWCWPYYVTKPINNINTDQQVTHCFQFATQPCHTLVIYRHRSGHRSGQKLVPCIAVCDNCDPKFEDQYHSWLVYSNNLFLAQTANGGDDEWRSLYTPRCACVITIHTYVGVTLQGKCPECLYLAPCA